MRCRALLFALLILLPQGNFYIGSAMTLTLVSQWARFGWGVCQISPWTSTAGKECLLLSRLCSRAAHRLFAQALKRLPSSSRVSWHFNQALLSQIPAFSYETKQLISFLERRWLAKANGFYSWETDIACPCFGFSVQVHPETTNSYARDPASRPSQTYKNRVQAWKQSLSENFPLILTRPFDIHEYLPFCFEIAKYEDIQTAVEWLAANMQKKIVVDWTAIFPTDREEWPKVWETHRAPFLKACRKRSLHIDSIICIQRIQQEGLGGVRILPLAVKNIDSHYRYLLDWVSCFGLAATPLEQDRWPSDTPLVLNTSWKMPQKFPSIDAFEKNWKSHAPEKTLMVQGMLQALKGLFTTLTDRQWNAIAQCPTRSSIMQLAFSEIDEQFKYLLQKEMSFFDTVSHVEQIHGHLSALLEIFSPFSPTDFSDIYRDLLTCIPTSLKPLTSCTAHASGMTSIAGIFKALKCIVAGRPIRVLYGENTYFECIHAAEQLSHVLPMDRAAEKDWNEADLLLAQFNPVLKRDPSQTSLYRVEKVAEALRKSLHAGRKKPLTLALDCTLDSLHSPRVAALLTAFQEEIHRGDLNIICYRSGLKFDLFGMDNFAGAPFYMIHNRDKKWAPFDILIKDPALQTDRLSFNWFCLAYKYAAPQLDLYRKQIFTNTRALLDTLSPTLYRKTARYRIVPVESDADPAFIDIKISGPLHQIKAACLVGGSLYLQCMEAGHPIFYRRSLGFYHPNFGILFGKHSTTIRLTLGLDPGQVDALALVFERIDALNGTYKAIGEREKEAL